MMHYSVASSATMSLELWTVDSALVPTKCQGCCYHILSTCVCVCVHMYLVASRAAGNPGAFG